MASDRFHAGMAIRVALILSTALLLSYVATRTDWYVSMGLLGLAVLGETAMLIRFASRWSREVTRFLDAVAYDDVSASFAGLSGDTAFGELGLAMDRVIAKLRLGRAEREEQAQYFKTLVNHVPVGLIAVEKGGKVSLLNFAARRLFEGSCARTSDFLRYGEAFAAGLENLKAGEGQILRMERKTGAVQLKAVATDLTLAGRQRRLVSLQNIESELTAHELAAWQTVIRVMAHEVMNSLTPVTSLAATALGLVNQAAEDLTEDDKRKALLTDAGEALETMTRRSEGLLHFVQNHRRLTKRMVANSERLKLERVFARLKRLLAADLDTRGVTLFTSVEPATLELDADPELLDQALINLMRNAIEALRDTMEGKIELAASRDLDGRTVIKVIDNGIGIPPDQREKVFVPFFTTKRQGSGVGLTLARQIMTVHGGMVVLSETAGGGTTVSMRF
jgi:two-component system, NtrC family, nitrogen regulation sensor histidine kinase NtrY